MRSTLDSYHTSNRNVCLYDARRFIHLYFAMQEEAAQKLHVSTQCNEYWLCSTIIRYEYIYICHQSAVKSLIRRTGSFRYFRQFEQYQKLTMNCFISILVRIIIKIVTTIDQLISARSKSEISSIVIYYYFELMIREIILKQNVAAFDNILLIFQGYNCVYVFEQR